MVGYYLPAKERKNRRRESPKRSSKSPRLAMGGQTWFVKQLEIPNLDASRGLSAETWLDFVDAAHGWVLVRVNGNTAMSGGVMRATDDGGTTWKTLGVPAAGPIRFITAADGWLDGGANADTE